MELSNAQGIVTRSLSRGGLLAKKYSPEILMGLGVIGIVTSAVMACKATLKLDEVMAPSEQELIKVHKGRETYTPDEYSQTDYQKDLGLSYLHRGLALSKLYGPAALIGVASISCLLGSHVILSKRNIAVMAAYKLIEDSFNKYRDRIAAEFGTDKERNFRFGITQETGTETVVDGDGKKSKQKITHDLVDPSAISDYAIFFDENSVEWKRDNNLNKFFLTSTQQYCTDALRSRGHLFLNEVYDMLGVPRTQAGSVVGWVMSKGGDEFVDFGIYEVRNADFVNGYERSILLDFNVDGLIYDRI